MCIAEKMPIAAINKTISPIFGGENCCVSSQGVDAFEFGFWGRQRVTSVLFWEGTIYRRESTVPPKYGLWEARGYRAAYKSFPQFAYILHRFCTLIHRSEEKTAVSYDQSTVDFFYFSFICLTIG